ncbi:hypothetical protein Tco_0558078 [Tanacetum coccineum]
MAEPILNENMEKAQTESNLSITSCDINIELSKELLEELQKNAYHGWINEDVVNHIAKVLEMIDLIYIPSVDSHQLRMKVFPLSLADNARQCLYGVFVKRIQRIRLLHVSIQCILGNGYGVSTSCTVLGPRWKEEIDELVEVSTKSGSVSQDGCSTHDLAQ